MQLSVHASHAQNCLLDDGFNGKLYKSPRHESCFAASVPLTGIRTSVPLTGIRTSVPLTRHFVLIPVVVANVLAHW